MPRYGLHLCYTLVTERERERKRERESVCMGWEEEVFDSANLRILCEVWISVHQSWGLRAAFLVGFTLNFLGFRAGPIRDMIICLYKIIKMIISLKGFCKCNN